jgi:hypothetical protein
LNRPELALFCPLAPGFASKRLTPPPRSACRSAAASRQAAWPEGCRCRPEGRGRSPSRRTTRRSAPSARRSPSCSKGASRPRGHAESMRARTRTAAPRRRHRRRRVARRLTHRRTLIVSQGPVREPQGGRRTRHVSAAQAADRLARSCPRGVHPRRLPGQGAEGRGGQRAAA